MRPVVLAGLLLAAHVALGFAVHGRTALGVDRDAFDLMDHVRTPPGVDVVRVLTDVGALPLSALAVILAAVAAHRAGRTREALALVGGMVLLVALVSLTKVLWDRPRPADRLSGVHSLSYPSGHTAYGTAWLAAAVTTRRRWLILAGGVVLIAVGASRLYLHVHYLTDVLGGAALAGAVFVMCLTRP